MPVPTDWPLESWLPSPSWHATVDDALEVLTTLVVGSLGTDWTLSVQGSVRQGLALRSSDLDVCVHRNRLEAALPALKAMASSLGDGEGDALRLERCLFRARVPVVRLAYEGLGIDVSAGDPSRGECDDQVRAVCSKSGDTVAGLCRFAKVFATTRRLHNAHKGGLSSFSWVLLALLFARTKEAETALKLRAPKRRKRALWIGLLRFVRTLPSGAVLGVTSRSRHSGQLFLAVPGQPEQNAARCLTESFWRRRVAPALDEGIRALEKGVGLPLFLSGRPESAEEAERADRADRSARGSRRETAQTGSHDVPVDQQGRRSRREAARTVAAREGMPADESEPAVPVQQLHHGEIDSLLRLREMLQGVRPKRGADPPGPRKEPRTA